MVSLYTLSRRFLIAACFIACFVPLYAQHSKADSLRDRLKHPASDTARINLLLALSEISWRTGEYDSSMKYATQAISSTNELQPAFANTSFSRTALIKAYNNIGCVAREKVEYDNALEAHYKAAKIGEEASAEFPNDTLLRRTLAITYNNIGGIGYFKGEYDKALAAYLKALRLFESIGDKPKIASCYSNIGLIHEGRKDYDKAKEYYLKALALLEKLGNKKGMANCYNNIGNVLTSKNDNDNALVYYFKAADINKEIGNKNWLAFNYENIGSVYGEKKEFRKSLSFHLQALEIRKEIGEVRGMSSSYASIGIVYFKMSDYTEAKRYSSLALETAKSIGAKPEMIQAYLTLAECDSATGNYKSAFTYHQLYAQVKDSVLNAESSKQIAEMQTKYETEKKESENQLLVKENKISTLEITRQKANRNILVIGFSLLLVLGLFLFNRHRLIARNKILQEKDLRHKAVFKAQEEEKGRLSKELHDGLGPLLSLIKLNASGLPPNPGSERMVEEIKELASEGMKEVRTISHALMPSVLQKNGLEAALKELVEQVNASGIMQVELIYTLPAQLPAEAGVNIYRIVQEAVNNAIKHAGATKVDVSLTANGEQLALAIQDNGKGFVPAEVKNGNGLNNMISRAEILKGTLQFSSSPGKGTRIVILIPNDNE